VERYRHGAELVQILDAIFGAKSLAEWSETLSQHRLIWAPVLTLAEAVEDAPAQAFGSFPQVEHPEHGAFRTVAPPLRMSGHGMDGRALAPGLAADTEAVLREAGVSEERIALLVAAATR
jgi:formyl-CoA transferase